MGDSKFSKQLEHILGSIGYIFYLTSLIEYNLIQILSGEKYLKVLDNENVTIKDINSGAEESNKTLHELKSKKLMLGGLIKLLKKEDIFEDNFLVDLQKVSEIRGYYAHQFFKDDLYLLHLDNDPLYYKEKINNEINFIYRVHEDIYATEQQYREIAGKLKNVAHLKELFKVKQSK